MEPTQKPKQNTNSEEPLKEKSSLFVESHLKISDPETKQQIVNMRA